MIAPPLYNRLSQEIWEAERRSYLAEVSPFVQSRRDRRSRGEKHPVEDFIWEYYSLRGGRLLDWHPGAGVIVAEAKEEDFTEKEGYIQLEEGRVLHAGRVLDKRSSGVRWILNLLRTIDARPPVFSCLGLHEWAMVYEEKDIRHQQLPLRLTHAETRRVVENLPLRCTHYDAFRFFSKSARPLNAESLTADSRTDDEQPGCLHANMDLFKWCMKLQPLVPSSLTLDCFRLACRARHIDMRASPYALGEFGGEPIRIETASGRADYVHQQQKIADEARPFRQQLIQNLEEVLEMSVS
jgi:hypothetical protein